MSSSPSGTGFPVEITLVERLGVCILAHGEELFMPYDEFPWFKDARIGAVLNVEEPTPGHFHWPELDVDLSLEITRHPERFPLKSRV